MSWIKLVNKGLTNFFSMAIKLTKKYVLNGIVFKKEVQWDSQREIWELTLQMNFSNLINKMTKILIYDKNLSSKILF